MRGYSGFNQLGDNFVFYRYTELRVGGGWTETWVRQGMFNGVLADPTETEIMQASQVGTARSHYLIAHGAPRARRGDIVSIGKGASRRCFTVETIEDPANLGRWTRYGLEEKACPTNLPD